MHHWLLRLGLLAALCAAPPLRSAEAVPNYGQIIAARVIGDVDAVNLADHTVTPLHNNDLIFQGYSIRTGPDASIVLVFSNGSTIRLAADTELSVDEFLQDPFAGEELAVEQLTAEPTHSSTKLNLVRGEVVGHVLSLHPGSTHEIQTPVGAAGIRGTVFRHLYRETDDGRVNFSSSTDEGEVEFTPTDGPPTRIKAAMELTSHGRRGRRGGAPFATHEISRRAKVVIDHHFKVMRASRGRVIFRRADARVARGMKPKLRRDPGAKREKLNDFKDIDREEKERERETRANPGAKPGAKKRP